VLYRNNGDGTFTDVTSQAGVGDARWSSSSGWADYDGDGLLDGGPVLLENRTQLQGTYLRVKAPVGARITVEAGGMRQVDEVRASGSHQSASEQVAHFGLGGASVVERIIIRFTNGKTRTMTKVEVNQSLTLVAHD
jgi:hypothetical protein